MEKDAKPASPADLPAPESMLLDCYMELIAYTGYIRKQGREGKAGAGEAAEVYGELVERSGRAAAAAGFSEDSWRQGLFPVCAWIDETLSCSEWPGRGQWESRQLQRKYFNTTSAGWQFYDRLDNLGEEENDVRAVYEFCLALGFRGRYFRTSDMGRIEDIQYTQLRKVTGDTEFSMPAVLFPEAYEQEQAPGQRKQNSRPRFSPLVTAAVILPLAVLGGLYFFLGHLLDQAVALYFSNGF